MRALSILLALFSLSISAPTPASAQDAWPSRAITIVVPYAAGTAPDIIARTFGDALATRVGQPVVIENKIGAGGLIGTEFAAAAKPDGHTLFLGTKDTQAIIGHLYAQRKFDPAQAFAPVSLLGRIVNVIVAGPDIKAETMKDLVAASKGGKTFTFASPGVGTNLHLLGELVKIRENLNWTHVPYRNFGSAFPDAMSGRVDLVVAGLPPTANLIGSKKLKALVQTGPQRVAALAEVPTMSELGYNDLTFVGWFGLLAPAGTPTAVLERLNRETREIAGQEGYRARMQKMHVDPVFNSPDDFKALIDDESKRLGEVIRKVDIKVE